MEAYKINLDHKTPIIYFDIHLTYKVKNCKRFHY